MPIQKSMRSIDLILELVTALKQQLKGEFFRVIRAVERVAEREWEKAKPYSRGCSIYFVDRMKQRRKNSLPGLFVVLIQESSEKRFSSFAHVVCGFGNSICDTRF